MIFKGSLTYVSDHLSTKITMFVPLELCFLLYQINLCIKTTCSLRPLVSSQLSGVYTQVSLYLHVAHQTQWWIDFTDNLSGNDIHEKEKAAFVGCIRLSWISSLSGIQIVCIQEEFPWKGNIIASNKRICGVWLLIKRYQSCFLGKELRIGNVCKGHCKILYRLLWKMGYFCFL